MLMLHVEIVKTIPCFRILDYVLHCWERIEKYPCCPKPKQARVRCAEYFIMYGDNCNCNCKVWFQNFEDRLRPLRNYSENLKTNICVSGCLVVNYKAMEGFLSYHMKIMQRRDQKTIIPQHWIEASTTCKEPLVWPRTSCRGHQRYCAVTWGLANKV